MKNLKKAVICSVMALILSTAVHVPQANAGILVLLGSQAITPGEMNPLGKSGLAITAVGLFAGYVTFYATGVVNPVGPALFLLDADGSLDQSVLANTISNKYPCIDNTDVSRNLAQALNDKFKEQSKEGVSKVFVSLKPEETKAILAPAALTSKQEDQIASDLN